MQAITPYCQGNGTLVSAKRRIQLLVVSIGPSLSCLDVITTGLGNPNSTSRAVSSRRSHLYTLKMERRSRCAFSPSHVSWAVWYYADRTYREGNKSNEYDDGFFSTEYYADNLIRYLKDRKLTSTHDENAETKGEDETQPFFAFLPFSAPHWPLQCSKSDRDHYNGVYKDGPKVLRERRLAKLKEMGFFDQDVKAHDVVVDATPEWEGQSPEERGLSQRAMECYAGMVEGIDRNCGKVFDYLKSTGEYDSEYRCVTSPCLVLRNDTDAMYCRYNDHLHVG